jgi:hypothetical protein
VQDGLELNMKELSAADLGRIIQHGKREHFVKQYSISPVQKII